MGRAVHQLARAKFGSEWTGDEHATRLPEPLPDCLDPEHYNALLHPESRTESAESAQWIDPPSRAVLERAYDLLITHRPDLQKPPRMFGLLGFPPRALRFTVREWKIAQNIASTERSICRAAQLRWLNLQALFVSLCESGIIETKLRPVDGGEFTEVLPRAYWRTENYGARFFTYMMDPERPFRTNNQPQGMLWIFSTETSMRRAIATVSGGREAGADGAAYASEYMRHMAVVVSVLGITAEHQPKKTLVETAVRDLWAGPVPLSNSDIKNMAGFIRSQASRAGKNKPPA